MKADPWSYMLASRKFWLLVWQLLTGTIILILDTTGAGFKPDVIFLIGALQVPVLAVIGSIAYEDVANVRAGVTTADISPILKLLQSRKFWYMIIDQVISVVLYFVGKYALVSLETVKQIIGILQPMVVFIIGAVAYEDAGTVTARLK